MKLGWTDVGEIGAVGTATVSTVKHTGRIGTSAVSPSIEPARSDEVERLTMLVRTSAAYAGHYRVMVAKQTVDAAYLDANVVRVAHGPDGEIWGFYSVLIPGRGGDNEGELDFMFVANDVQRRGVGRALLDDLRTVASQHQLARVHIVSHPPSERFYLSCGARRVGLIPPSGRISWTRPHLTLDIHKVAQA